jgi:hypothetical protein
MTSLGKHLMVAVAALGSSFVVRAVLDRRELGEVKSHQATLLKQNPDCGRKGPAVEARRVAAPALPSAPSPAQRPLAAASEGPAPQPRAPQPPPLDLPGMAARMALRPDEVQQLSRLVREKGSEIADAISKARTGSPTADSNTAELQVMVAGLKAAVEAERQYVALLGADRAVQAERMGFELGRELAREQKEFLERTFPEPQTGAAPRAEGKSP